MVAVAFSTARLRAERMTAAHAGYLAELHGDPHVMAMIGGARDADESAAWLHRNLEHWDDHGFGQWMFRDATGRLIGRGGLRWIDPCVGEQIVEVGYAFRQSVWGQGIATEAATAIVTVAREQYHMPELGAITLVGNDASARVVTKCGFVYERTVAHPVGPHRFFRLTL